ncbi:hypothetical protein [Tardiphaga sp.]|uniref:hypothetical protein n=1 Tax=Tardiphaga sp. TaxID=1926292 RepID=UPI0026131396|nr:hypothetical protein [Tardiphaga sp.]
MGNYRLFDLFPDQISCGQAWQLAGASRAVAGFVNDIIWRFRAIELPKTLAR